MTSARLSQVALQVKEIPAGTHLDFLSRHHGSFLQRPGWAPVKADWSPEYLGWYHDDTLVASALVLHRRLPLPVLKKTLAYLPEGPVADWDAVLPEDPADLSALLDPMLAHFTSRGVFQVRIGPSRAVRRWEARVVRKEMPRDTYQSLTEMPPAAEDHTGQRIRQGLAAAGWRKLPGGEDFDIGRPEFRAEVPLVDPDGVALDFTQALAQMNQNARRETKKALAGLVEVTRTESEGVDRFHAMYVETAQRDGFMPRPLAYLRTVVSSLNQEVPGTAQVYLATQDGADVAGAIRIRQGDRSVYMWAASTPAAHKVYAAKAIFGRIVQDSIEDGCVCVDQDGVSPTLDRSHPLAGLTVFKTTLGGDIVQTVGEWEYDLNRVLAKALDLAMALRSRLVRR